jgi:AraC-like DNA-binding protein
MTWGHPDRDDIAELARGGIPLCVAEERVPYRLLVDLRDLEMIDPTTFAPFLEHSVKHRDALHRKIIRLAQIHSGGFVGAIISGFALVAKLAYPERAFRDVADAVDWIGLERTEGLALLAELEQIRRDLRGSHAVVERLRRDLDAGTLAIDEAARRFGLSTRTFQRALRDAGTTYRAELHAHRLRRAQELLRSDRPISWIAAEVGFAGAPHFATAYKRATGETPTEWRARNGDPTQKMR